MRVNTADLTKEQNELAVRYVCLSTQASGLESRIARFEKTTSEWLEYAYREWRQLNNDARQAERAFYGAVPDASTRLD